MRLAPVSRRVAAMLFAFGMPVTLAAQQEAPVYNVLSFKLTITGKGSDPNPSDANNPPSVPSQASQEWTCSRVIEGWYEVDVLPERGARSDAKSGRLRFKPRPNGRHSIRGERWDRGKQTYQEAGEGSDVVGCATYRATELFTAHRDLAKPAPSLLVALDPQNAQWTTPLIPAAWCGELDQNPNYVGWASYDAPKNGGLGDDWQFHTTRLGEDPPGDAFLETRYSPGRRGGIGFAMMMKPEVCPAEFVKLDESLAGGTVVKGHVPFKIDKPRDVPGTWSMEGTIDWVVRVDLPDVELKVLIPDYTTWRPNAAQSAAGEPLQVIAYLVHGDPNKRTPLPKVRAFTWQLVGTSKEPGIAMNMPYAAGHPGPDLSLESDEGSGDAREEGQTLVVAAPTIAACRIRVVPWDWGGWGTLRVKAELVDGRVIHGELEGGPAIIGSQRDIPIPARIPGSKIAMGWLEEKGWSWTGDAEDSDPSPIGKARGDGFTLYEEYRGFYWGSGEHLSTDPFTKDLFVRIEPGAASWGTPALARFTGLAVHWTKRGENLPNAAANQRTVNINIGMGATAGPQTALYVTDQISPHRINDLIPPGSRPATVPKIDLPSLAAMSGDDVPLGVHLGGLAADTQTLLRSQLTQALLQACGVQRPGASDRVQRVTFVPGNVTVQPQQGSAASTRPHFLIGGTPALIYLGPTDVAEAMAESIARTGIPVADQFLVVGAKGGAHSGPEDCVMRDWFAALYRTHIETDGLPVYRYAPAQRYGNRLGDTRAGTGINAKNHRNGSAFGDSAVAEPARQQLVVKDRSP